MNPLILWLTDPLNLLTLMAVLGAGFAFISLGRELFQSNALDERMKSVATRREELRLKSRQAIANSGSGSSSLRQTDESAYRKIVEKLNLQKLLEDPTLGDKLAQAGFRGPQPVSIFYFARAIAPFALAALVFFYIKIGQVKLVDQQVLLAVVGGLVAGYYAPNLYLENAIQKRRDSIVSVFPDALDLLLICVESGMSIESALQKVSAEIGSRSIELAEELSLMVAELSYLPERRQAYEGLGKRINHPGVKAVATAMIQAEKYGTPLGGALRIMAKENRDMRMSAAEKKAAALPAQLTVPMIIFFLPVIFLVILGPLALRFMSGAIQFPGAPT